MTQRTKSTIALSLGLAALASAVALFGYLRYREIETDKAEWVDKARGFAEFVADAARAGLIFEDETALRDSYSGILRQQNLAYVEIVDAAGISRVRERRTVAAVPWSGPPQAITAEQFKQNVLHVSAPISQDDRIVGAAYLGFSLEGMHAQQRAVNLIAVAFVALLLAGGVVISFGVFERQKLKEDIANAERARLEELEKRVQLELERQHSQKLESVGRLAAGVAHEINTPVQFVSDSISFLKDAMASLFMVTMRYRSLLAAARDHTLTDEILKTVEDAEEEADLAYLLDNVPKALDRSLDGLARVTAIVRSMKEFAHPDKKDKTAIDLNRAIQSTLIIARNEYKYVADLETNLGEIPPVVCHAGEINQTILNIVVNAAHAIADVVKGTANKGKITVSTRLENNDVVISISDTGGGIPENVRDKIFDPFFTTKPVGQGTGQGLAIARNVVVEKHGGSLTFDSQPGHGTTFLIHLPLVNALEAASS